MPFTKSKKIMIFVAMIMFVLIITACSNSEKNEQQLKRYEDTEFELDSGIRIDDLNETQKENLFILAKVWGFVKYRHPDITKGKLNWDSELFRIMPKVLKAKNEKEATDEIAKWLNQFPFEISKLEETQEKLYRQNQDELYLEYDLSWISDKEVLGDKLVKYLEALSTVKVTNTENSYAVFDTGGSIDFSSDSFMEDSMIYEDSGMRLLGLFRYWNIVEYFYPYKNLIDEDWDKILYDKISELALEKSKESYVLSIANLTTYIHDSHGFFFDDFRVLERHFGTYIPKVEFLNIDGQIVIIQGEHKSKLIRGDIVISVDGIPIEKRIEECKKYISVSNNARFIYSFSKYLLRSKKEISAIEVIRNGQKLDLQVPCESKVYPIMSGEKSGFIEDKKVGYINLDELENSDFDKLMDKFKNTEGLIIDARYGNATFVNYILAEYLKPKPTEYAQLSKSNPFQPGDFYKDFRQTSGQGYIKEVYASGMNPILFNKIFNNGLFRTLRGKVKSRYEYDKKVILLMNECTISHLETTIMSLESAPKAMVIGTASNGANGDVTKITLPGGIDTYMSGIAFDYSDGKQMQRVGITPDIVVEPTVEGIAAGRDELMEKAIDLILESD